MLLLVILAIAAFLQASLMIQLVSALLDEDYERERNDRFN